MSTFGSNDLDDVVDASGFGEEQATPKEGGKSCDKPGMYHVHVKGVKAEGSFTADAKGEWKTPCVRLDFEILAGTEADQVGKMIFHRIYRKKAEREGGKSSGRIIGLTDISDASREQMLRVAYQLGVMSKEDMGNAKAAVRWSQAEGLQAIVRVDREEEEDFKDHTKKRIVYRINFGNVWGVHHPDVVDVPRDVEAMAMAGAPAAAVDVTDL